MLSKRFEYDGKPAIRLNELQLRMKRQIESKIEDGTYSFEEVPCCVCGGRNCEILSEKDRYGLYVPVVICKDCGLIQTNPRMTQEAYNQFYELEYSKLYREGLIDVFFKFQYERGKEIYQYLKNNLKIDLINLKVLEVGTGVGGILYAFKEKGNEVYGCDLGSEYIAFGRDKYNLNLQIGTIEDIDASWTPDIVIYSHVLEHILNPMRELSKLKSIVDDNSYIYIEVPALRYIKKYCGGNLLCWVQNAHVYYFTLKTLRNIMKKTGYDIVTGDEISNIHSIFKKSSSKNLQFEFENDYNNAISFLRRMEFYRFVPAPYNVKQLTMPVMVSFLKRVGLYNTAKEVYYKIKS
ncbi:2-polyprenyl-3-methyl-5-hydroxy-6-metoxy-1,4-benzoquinol methylase [Candidatus Methanophagaceae archaeon]|nr:2-polyprenyl-3-methyl-5-hydroxy-6-metoxy-1,4-benzoquinol methylase [Methanophagales archaeon]